LTQKLRKETAVQRREFIKQTTAAAGTLAAAEMIEAAQPKPQAIPVVDTHLHLWDLKRFRLPWVQKGSPLARSFVMKDFLTAVDGLNVTKAVYMEVDVEVGQQRAEAEYVFEICRQDNTPLKAAVISGRPANDDFRKYLEGFKRNQYLKGVRQVLHNDGTPAGYCLAANFMRGIRLLGDMNLSFDLCMRSAELADGIKLIEACPNTRFILDHCGNMNVQAKDRTQWQRDMERMARSKNVVCKVSGIVASARPEKWRAEDLAPIINHTFTSFGADRVMFGGDWPVCTLTATYRQWLEALKNIVAPRPLEERRKLFHDNAVRFYGLK
jgi:predicted TIM-barrel fold metal-dependent hydrolase